MTVTRRNAVTVSGRPAGRPMMFAHGHGCDQRIWRFVAPAFADTHRIVLFDHVGSGRSDLTAYDERRYATLDAYAADILDIIHACELWDVIFVGHAGAAMMGVLAAKAEPERFAHLVLIGPSPCYVNDGAYVGGFTAADIDDMLDALDGNADSRPAEPGRPRPDPEVCRQFARVTFLSDHRAELPHVRTPSLILQCADDVVAPTAVGEYVHAHLPGSRYVALRATGHCPILSAPAETVAAITAYLRGDG